MKPDGWFTKPIEGRHVLMGLIAFFGVMLCVNGIFLYLALTTFAGGDTADPYRKGLNYNATLAAAERQAERGWRTDMHYDQKEGRLTLSVLDMEQQPIAGLDVEAMMSRPATDKEDRPVSFRPTGQGLYSADVELAPGLWVISIAADEPGTPLYLIKRRVFVASEP